ncbi:protein HP-25 homolog 1-like [Pecten maximus]|uniref:protein HP-25 homolog 1-like n=1 Tax=Pecten maximus TaxID=6579 RepID=UPI0014583D0C|nr:protein HP-25 homolog 1-like [Pecten maximus]
MAYGVVLVVVLAVSIAINGQQDYKYDTLLSEVSALKKSISNLNAEMEKLRERNDDMSEKLRAVMSCQRPPNRNIDDHLPGEGSKEKSDMLHKRSAYTPSFHLPLNISRVALGQKGEKGNSGIQGPKGDSGTPGPQGIKGDPGPVGPTLLQEQIGNKGVQSKIAFSARLLYAVTHIGQGRAIVFDEIILNIGQDYDPSSGIFQCSIPGIYVFTWSIEVNASNSLITGIYVNGQSRQFQFVAGSSYNINSGSSTIVLELTGGDTVFIGAFRTPSHDTVVESESSLFSGYLLS